MWYLHALDYFFLIFHSAFIVFNLFAWIPRLTRRWNLIALGLTAFSWLGLGLFYGIGYCPLTHWHWIVRDELHKPPMPNSYIQFLVEEGTGLHFSAVLVDTMTAVLFSAALLASLFVNLRDMKKQSREKRSAGR